MKKLILITGAVLAVYLIMITAASRPQEAYSAQAVTAEARTTGSEYKIGISDGRVAAFKNGALYIKTDTRVSSLPKADQNRLKEGIYLYSEKELKQYLQDYCS